MIKHMIASLIFSLTTCAFPAPAQTTAQLEDEAKREQAQAAILKAQMEQLGYLYGTAAKPKSGDIVNLEKLSGMAQPNAPRLGRQLGASLRNALQDIDTAKNCNSTFFVVDGDTYYQRRIAARSVKAQIDKYKAMLNPGASPGITGDAITTLSIGVPGVLAVLGGISSIVGIFRADYTVQSANFDLDTNWVMSSMQLHNAPGSQTKMHIERFPDSAEVDKLAD